MEILIRFLLSLVLISFFSYTEPASAVTPIQSACHIVKGWPDDYAKLWPKAVTWHNKSPNTNKASDYMKNYIEMYVKAFKIKDKAALNVIQGYEVYWGQFESDVVHNNGKFPTGGNAPSTQILSMLYKICEKVKDF